MKLITHLLIAATFAVSSIAAQQVEQSNPMLRGQHEDRELFFWGWAPQPAAPMPAPKPAPAPAIAAECFVPFCNWQDIWDGHRCVRATGFLVEDWKYGQTSCGNVHGAYRSYFRHTNTFLDCECTMNRPKNICTNQCITGEYTVLPAPVVTTVTAAPIVTPTRAPTETPVVTPTSVPTEAPVVTPTSAPTETPVVTPTHAPVAAATAAPVATPTSAPVATTTAPVSSATVSPLFSVRINCGASAPYVDAAGNTWLADDNTKGDTFAACPKAIAGTVDDTIYCSERYGTIDYGINVPVGGNYQVNLHFAEIFCMY